MRPSPPRPLREVTMHKAGLFRMAVAALLACGCGGSPVGHVDAGNFDLKAGPASSDPGCPTGTKCCSVTAPCPLCVPTSNCCADSECTIGGQTCNVDGACRCPVGQKVCETECVPNDNCCENADC